MGQCRIFPASLRQAPPPLPKDAETLRRERGSRAPHLKKLQLGCQQQLTNAEIREVGDKPDSFIVSIQG